jgi:hypothetical protein
LAGKRGGPDEYAKNPAVARLGPKVVKKVEQCAVELSTVNRTAPQGGERLSAGLVVARILSDRVGAGTIFNTKPRILFAELVVVDRLLPAKFDRQLPPIKPRLLPTRLTT